MMLTWNPFPLRSTRFSLVYLLLSPRSALITAPIKLTLIIFNAIITPAYTYIYIITLKYMILSKYFAQAPSIFKAAWFGRWVVTRSLADSDFHGHRPAVRIKQHFLWGLMSKNFGTLTIFLVHPTSPVLLTKNGPLKTIQSKLWFNY